MRLWCEEDVEELKHYNGPKSNGNLLILMIYYYRRNSVHRQVCQFLNIGCCWVPLYLITKDDSCASKAIIMVFSIHSLYCFCHVRKAFTQSHPLNRFNLLFLQQKEKIREKFHAAIMDPKSNRSPPVATDKICKSLDIRYCGVPLCTVRC